MADQYYFLDERQLRLIERVEKFLYGPKIKTGDQIRDNANLLNLVRSEIERQILDEPETKEK